MFGDDTLIIVDKLEFLGLVIHEFLGTIKAIAQIASRAVMYIEKCKFIGGVPYNVYTKLHEAII